MKIALGADHAGWRMKNDLCRKLAEEGHEVTDLGTDGDASVDYPDFAARVAREIVAGRAERGVLVCGTGIGMSMTANRHRGIRAAVCRDLYDTRLAREHNDANVLCIGARIVASALAEEMCRTFLAVPFAGGRHERRIALMDGMA